MKIGKKIKELRKSRSIKQYELAKRLDVSAPYLCQVEKGEKKPSLELIVKAASVFNMPSGELIVLALCKSPNKKETQVAIRTIVEPFIEYLIK